MGFVAHFIWFYTRHCIVIQDARNFPIPHWRPTSATWRIDIRKGIL